MGVKIIKGKHTEENIIRGYKYLASLIIKHMKEQHTNKKETY